MPLAAFPRRFAFVPRCTALGLALLLAAPAAGAAADDRAILARARQFYNAGRYDAAIEAARLAEQDPASADAARLVLGRARLERYRETGAGDDLAAAREALRRIDPGGLTPGDRQELLVGMGLALYLEEAYGAAAELFGSALDLVQGDADDRERALDWWATAIDRQAQARAPTERAALYVTVLERMELELQHDPAAGAAVYWLAAAARGSGDLHRGWSAAVAGWVRAPLARDGGASLRADLDRLVVEAIIPERARATARPGRDAEEIEAGMRAEWEQVKVRWTPPRP